MSNFKAEELTKEKNLLAIYLVSRRTIPDSKLGLYSTLFIAASLLFYSLSSFGNPDILLNTTRSLCSTGFDFSASILGFLIAGFTIFTSLSDQSLFLLMAKMSHPSGLSYLKYNLFSFMKVFITYALFSVICFVVNLFGHPGGAFSVLFHIFFRDNSYAFLGRKILISSSVVFVGTWFFYLLMLLQTFIFNTYHVVMTSIRWEEEKYQVRKHRKGQED